MLNTVSSTTFFKPHWRCEEFLRDTSANVTMTFAFLGVAIVMFLGTAVDYNRALNAKVVIARTIDAAALAGARKLVTDDSSDSVVAATVGDVVAVNFLNAEAAGAQLLSLSVSTDREDGEVNVDAEVRVDTIFTRIASIDHIDISMASTAKFLPEKDIELAMMLDVTGSMGGSRITDLKVAAKDLVDVLLPEGKTLPNKVRIGLIPYSQGVNAGTYAAAATNGASTSCATERSGLQAYTDASYLSAPVGNGSSGCPASTLLPLTDNRASLISKIDGFSTGGYTAGHTGIGWSWYMLSPNWTTLWPAESAVVPYDDDETVKVAILMTDGAFNTVYDYVSSEEGGEYVETYSSWKSRQRARALCEAMKDEDIKIYTIAFEVSSWSAKEVMKDCASDDNMYFDASSGTELRIAFNKIAGQISELRIAR